MAHATIKKNITRLLVEKNWKISEVEKKLGSGRSITSILRDKSKNPTIEVLQSIANAFDVQIEEIINEPALTGATDIKLLSNVCTGVINEIHSLNNIDIGYSSILSIIKEVYEYSIHLNLEQVDINFIKWTIDKKRND